MATYNLISQPTQEPLTLSEAKAQLRIIESEVYDDVYISALITTARMQVENMTWRALCPQQWQLVLDYYEVRDNGNFNYQSPNYGLQNKIIEIEKCPLISVDSIQYYDVNNTLQTLSTSAYQVDVLKEPARVQINTMPICYNRLNAFIVNFTAGYSRTYANPVQVTSIDLTSNVITSTAHGLRNSNIIDWTALGTVTGISLATDYYVINRTDNTFQISTTLNGSAVDLTGSTGTLPTYQNQQLLSIPEPIKSAMKIMISDLYTNRETVVTSRLTELKTIENILNQYTLNWHVPH